MKKRILSLLPAALVLLVLAACGGKAAPATPEQDIEPWVIRNDDYDYANRYFPFDDYEAGEDYWAKDVVRADRDLETGILYVKNRETGEITRISKDPVRSFAWNFGNTLLYATEKGELWRSGLDGERQAVLYTSDKTLDKLYFAYKGQVSREDDLSYVWPRNELFFLDGSTMVDLDLDTGEATLVTEVDAELFYAFYPWIDGRMAWNNLDGQFRAYDPVTKSVVIVTAKEEEQPEPIRAFVETMTRRNSIRIWSEEVPALNCTVVLPASWAGKWDVAVWSSSITVYSSQVRENNPVDEYTGERFGGKLFNMNWGRETLPESFELDMPGKILKNDEGVNVMLTYSSDVQCTAETEAAYQAMTADLQQIQVVFDE
ncbi:MAG: hypothetical protein IJL08_00575 [Oscillospiraceae bacterium]|nr:hypothetical protein [Oscillospiraceae bacterium]